jgi:hypothetical protein
MPKLDLSNITLITLTSNTIDHSLNAIKHCLEHGNFGEVLFFTHQDFVEEGIKFIKIPEIKSKLDYSRVILTGINQYINTDYVLVVQWDGFIVNGDSWDPSFLNYDYVGAPWPWLNDMVGNGGFSLRSKKLVSLCDSFFKSQGVETNEDVLICEKYRWFFEINGCEFAPSELAYKFSTESGDYSTNNSFGFHDWNFNNPFNLKEKIING